MSQIDTGTRKRAGFVGCFGTGTGKRAGFVGCFGTGTGKRAGFVGCFGTALRAGGALPLYPAF